MSKTRAIKVESCSECRSLGRSGMESVCTMTSDRVSWDAVFKAISDVNKIPYFCPLPAWPSVTKKSIGYWRELIKQFEADGLDSIDVFEDMFKSIGVEIKEVRDDHE